MAYCMMLAVYAKSERWDSAYGLLDEMCINKVSQIHQVIGQMIKGDFDHDSNWQIVEYALDILNSEGCSLGMSFYNALLVALWWLNQRDRAARVLNEATKRGLLPELFRKNKLVWSVDVHRMSEGGAYAALFVWLNSISEMYGSGDLPQLATIVVVRGQMEKSSVSGDTPIAKATHSFLQENPSSSFVFPGWNKGRIMSQKSQLKRFLSSTEPPLEQGYRILTLSNAPLPLSGSRKSVGQYHSTLHEGREMKKSELLRSTA